MYLSWWATEHWFVSDTILLLLLLLLLLLFKTFISHLSFSLCCNTTEHWLSMLLTLPISCAEFKKLNTVLFSCDSFCRAMLCKRGLCCHVVCVSVCLSMCVCVCVTFVHSVKTNKHIFKICSPSGSHTILFFHTKRHSNIPTGTPIMGALNAGGVGLKSWFWANIWLHKSCEAFQPEVQYT